MKNKYLTKCLCITLISTMVLTGPMAVFASETEAFASEDFSDSTDPDFTDPGDPTPDPTQPPVEPTIAPVEPTATPIPTDPTEPSVTPEPTDPTVTPEPTDPTVTPTPTDPTVTPTPVDPTVTPIPTVTPTPVPGITDNARAVFEKINAMALVTITLEQKDAIAAIRAAYDALTEEEKAQVTNYNLLVGFEAKITELEKNSGNGNATDPSGITDGTGTTSNALTGNAVYYSNYATNLHAGKDFYLDSLKSNYQLTFSDDFSSVMDEIESEYKEKNKLTDASDLNGNGLTTSADSLLVRNWQDIIAVYVYEQSKAGADSYTLDASSKEALAKIFAEMNPVVRDKQNITKVSYGDRHINYYIKKNNIAKSDREILKKYVETDCKLLCATVTAAKGFVRESVGDDVSEERVNVIAAAFSLVGKVGYFWGGKSTVIGDDPSWGTAETVSAEGSKSSGTTRAYGLDCSGFVTWAVINGYESQDMQGAVGDGTSDQWTNANVVSEADAQPGDLVFQRGPEAGSDNHVGILVGKTDSGDWIAVHCSSSKNGVTVGEAYSASFRYIRQPSFYPTAEELAAMESQRSASTSAAEDEDFTSTSTDTKDTTSILDAVSDSSDTFSSTDTTDTSSTPDSIENVLTSNSDKILITSDQIEVFTGK